MNVRHAVIGIVTCVGVYFSVALVTWYDVIDHAPSERFTKNARLFSLEHGHKYRNKHHLLEDKWQTAFIPYLRGVHKHDFECHDTKHESYVHNFTYPPNFSCNSAIQNLTTDERSQKTRQQLRIWCDDDHAMSRIDTVPLSAPFPTFADTASRACLHRYIQQECYDEYPIPNIVHWIAYGNNSIETWLKALPFYSVFTILKPCLVLLHGEPFTPGPLHDAMIPFATNLVRLPKEPQTHVQNINGSRLKIKHLANQADIGRLEVLVEFGGVYLDADELILKPVDIFRASGFSAFEEGRTNQLSNAVMFARPNHDVAKTWLRHYNVYDGENWASHSIFYLTHNVSVYRPDVFQAFSPVFIRFDWKLVPELYYATCSVGDSFGAHFYQFDYAPQNIGIDYLKKANTTYGRLARYVMFNNADICV